MGAINDFCTDTKKRDTDITEIKSSQVLFTSTRDNEAYLRRKVDEAWAQYNKGKHECLSREEILAYLRLHLKDSHGKEPSSEEVRQNFKLIKATEDCEVDRQALMDYLKDFRQRWID